MTQWRVLCPRKHLLKATTTTGDIHKLSSYRYDDRGQAFIDKTNRFIDKRVTHYLSFTGRRTPRRLRIHPTATNRANRARDLHARGGPNATAATRCRWYTAATADHGRAFYGTKYDRDETASGRPVQPHDRAGSSRPNDDTGTHTPTQLVYHIAYSHVISSLQRCNPWPYMSPVVISPQNEAIHRALCIVKCGIIGAGLVYTVTHSTDGAT